MSSSTNTDSVVLFLAQISELSPGSNNDNNNNSKQKMMSTNEGYCSDTATAATTAALDDTTDYISQNNFSVRLRNHLGLKLLISANNATESEAETRDSDRPEDSSPCSPVSAISGSSSTATGDDSGFSSDENRSSEKQYKLSRTKSLRSALRSPAHAGKRKSVRFADSLGLDLEQKTYFDSDDYRDNELCNFTSPFTFNQNKSNLHRKMVTLDPVNIPNRSEAEVSHMTRTQCVCLNSVSISDTNLSGTIHVLNLACEKQVCVRYTSDGWSSFSETRAIFTRSVGSDGAVDSFSFFLAMPCDIPVGATCEFCVHYTVNNTSYWDNNSGQNYKLQCVEENETVNSTVDRTAYKSWVNKSSCIKSFLDYDEDDEDDFYYYTPSYNMHSSKKGYFEQRYGCSYGDHLHFY